MEKKKKKEKVITVGDVEFKVLFGGLLPQISDEEYQRFKASIKEMGVLVPMLTDEDRDIIDRICNFPGHMFDVNNYFRQNLLSRNNSFVFHDLPFRKIMKISKSIIDVSHYNACVYVSPIKKLAHFFSALPVFFLTNGRQIC